MLCYAMQNRTRAPQEAALCALVQCVLVLLCGYEAQANAAIIVSLHVHVHFRPCVHAHVYIHICHEAAIHRRRHTEKMTGMFSIVSARLTRQDKTRARLIDR